MKSIPITVHCNMCGEPNGVLVQRNLFGYEFHLCKGCDERFRVAVSEAWNDDE